MANVGNKDYFIDPTCDLGEVSAGKHNVKWVYKNLKLQDLALDKKGKPLFKLGCGCTADPEFSKTGITGSINLTTKGENTKSIKLFLKPEDPTVPLYSKNSKGVKQINQNLDSFFIYIKGKVKK